VRGEPNGRNMEGCVRAAVLTGDRGGGAVVRHLNLPRGSVHGALNGLWWSAGGGESSLARRSGAREGRPRDGRKMGGDGGVTLLRGAAGRQ
jgi:hypothetical protein